MATHNRTDPTIGDPLLAEALRMIEDYLRAGADPETPVVDYLEPQALAVGLAAHGQQHTVEVQGLGDTIEETFRVLPFAVATSSLPHGRAVEIPPGGAGIGGSDHGTT